MCRFAHIGILAAALTLPHAGYSQEAKVEGKKVSHLSESAEPDLSKIIESWASEMDHVFAETRIDKQDTSTKIFKRLGIKDAEFIRYVNRIPGKTNPMRSLVPGRLIQAKLTPEGKVLSLKVFKPMDTMSTKVSFAEISRPTVKTPFNFQHKSAEYEVSPAAVSGTITTTLEQAGKDARIPMSVMQQFRQQLESRMDLKKDLAKGDSFGLIYERRELDGVDLGSGRLLAFQFYNKGEPVEAFWFEDENTAGYFDRDGKTNEQTFIRIPTQARVTSAFNQLRRHPVTGRLRPHYGVDLGAPIGTPVVASSDGKISLKRYERKGYGYWLEIDHGRGYSSTYAHLSKYAPDIEVGKQVKKGQVIGYVGRTGLATGPHLHYELKKNGAQVNPLVVNLPTMDGIPEDVLEQYQQTIAPVQRQLALLGKMHFASAGDPTTDHN